MNTYICISETIKLEGNQSETRYYVYNTKSKHRHSEWKSFEQARIAASDLNRMLLKTGIIDARDY